jgi:hypothetical protein
MALRADTRFWTVIVVITLCGLALTQGFSVSRFSVALANVDPTERRAKSMGAWTGVPGVSSTALETELADTFDPSDWKASNQRRDQLTALLAIKPLSSTDWLAFSGMQLTTAQPRPLILGSLLLSWVTGPNEGYVMAERGVFGLTLWEVLSPELRARVTADVAKAEIGESGKFRAVLSTKSEEVKNEIRNALLRSGLSPEEIERRAGL